LVRDREPKGRERQSRPDPLSCGRYYPGVGSAGSWREVFDGGMIEIGRWEMVMRKSGQFDGGLVGMFQYGKSFGFFEKRIIMDINGNKNEISTKKRKYKYMC
jgi:hypothetical protein